MMLQVGNEARHDEQINLALAEDLVGDEMAIMLGVLGIRMRQGHEKMIPHRKRKQLSARSKRARIHLIQVLIPIILSILQISVQCL